MQRPERWPCRGAGGAARGDRAQCDGEFWYRRAWTAYVELYPPAYRVYARRARRRASLVRAAAGALIQSGRWTTSTC